MELDVERKDRTGTTGDVCSRGSDPQTTRLFHQIPTTLPTQMKTIAAAQSSLI